MDEMLQQRAENGRARGTVLAAHAELSLGLALRLAPRVPPRRTLQLYCAALEVAEADAAWLQAHAVRSAAHQTYERCAESRHGVMRFRDWMRVHSAPHGDPQLRLLLNAEIERCRDLLATVRLRLDAGHTFHVPGSAATVNPAHTPTTAAKRPGHAALPRRAAVRAGAGV
jgi:hypothetical protein